MLIQRVFCSPFSWGWGRFLWPFQGGCSRSSLLQQSEMFSPFFSCALVLCPAFLKWWCRDLWDDLRPKCTHYLQCFEGSHAPRLVTSLFLFLLLKGLLLFVLITWFVCWETLHLCGGNASLLQQQLCWLSKNNRLECFQRPADGTALLSY